MRTHDFTRAAGGMLAAALLAFGGAHAQGTQDSATTLPQAQTMTDTAPAPATERHSLGAVIMMDQPVLAQREAMKAAQERSAVDTRMLGAGPARVLRSPTPEELELQKAFEAAERARGR